MRPFHLNNTTAQTWKLAVLTLLAVLSASVLWCGCGQKETAPPEDPAAEIYQKAEALHQEGKILEALKEYDKLAEYENSEYYQKAYDKLLKQGISVGGALESWTVKKMYDIRKNLAKKEQTMRPGEDMEYKLAEQDAWGRHFRVRHSIRPTWAFAVFSSGPDQEHGTGDDLILTYQRKWDRKKNDFAPAPAPTITDQAPAPSPEPEPEPEPDRASEPKHPDLPAPNKNGEIHVELDQLLEN